MRVVITGITGFVGGHLAEALLEIPGLELHGLSRKATWSEDWRHLQGRIPLWSCDLAESGDVAAILREIKPGQIYHLAGYAHAGKSFAEPDTAWAGNLYATRRLYDAVANWGGQPRIVFVGSGLVYGEAGAAGSGLDENALLCPASPYACSKAAADLLSFQYTRSAKLDIVRARPFNHFGPAQTPQYAIANFARQIVAIEKGLQPPVLETGNLQPRRDLTDVRDVVAAYLLLMKSGRVGEIYNIASGEAHSMQSILDRMLTHARSPVSVRQSKELMREGEIALVRGDAGKIGREIGWHRRFSLDESLQAVLDYWRSKDVSNPSDS